MRLGLEHEGRRFEMRVLELPYDSEGNPGVAGFRDINNILLFKTPFKQFIEYLQADEFEEIRLLFEKLLDTYTKELPYKKDLTRIYVTEGDTDPLLKQLIG